jgi:uncharacterized protein YecE (DUF72 family)
MIRIGTAGWAIPASLRDRFPGDGSILERYARYFNSVEINSCFYRSHKPQTYRRWATAVPDVFRFAVKLPKTITHEHRLIGAEGLMGRFVDEIAGLGLKLGPILVQLPPSLSFEASMASDFFGSLRERTATPVCCEPRHRTWFERDADALMKDYDIARVAADPACTPAAGVAGGWPDLAYIRLHGSPQMYHSAYGRDYIARLSKELDDYHAADKWCVFDNTARGAATSDAMILREMVESKSA